MVVLATLERLPQVAIRQLLLTLVVSSGRHRWTRW